MPDQTLIALVLIVLAAIYFYFAASRFAYGRDEDWVYDPLSWRRLLRRLPLPIARAFLASWGVLALAGSIVLLLTPAD